MTGIPQEKTVTGIPQEKTVMGIPQDDGDSPGGDCDGDSPDGDSPEGSDGDSPGKDCDGDSPKYSSLEEEREELRRIVEGESPEVNLRRWSVRSLDAEEKGNLLKLIAAAGL